MHSVTSNAVAELVSNKGDLKAPEQSSGDFNIYCGLYLPNNRVYFLSLDINNFSNRPVTATGNRRPALFEFWCTTSGNIGSMTKQKVSFCDFNLDGDGVWKYYEYERILIDTTWFSWQLTRALRI